MTKYTKGRALEYKVKKLLEAQGWYVVRSAGSHGAADLIAFQCKGEGSMILAIQCKLSKIWKSEREAFAKSFALQPGVTPCIATKEFGGTVLYRVSDTKSFTHLLGLDTSVK